MSEVPEVVSGEIIPADAVIMGYVGLPEGYIPHQPVPAGFKLHTVITGEEIMNNASLQAFVDGGLKLRYKYGRDSVFTGQNIASERHRDTGRIVLATFLKHDAQQLPRIVRLRRMISRTMFNIDEQETIFRHS